MATTTVSISHLSDSALLLETDRLAANERTSTAALIEALAEVDARRLYLAEGYSCMFFYCTRRLYLSEQAAYTRIEVARVSRSIPQILGALETGALNLTTARVIAPHLTRENHVELMLSASFKSKREVERLIANAMESPTTRLATRFSSPRTRTRTTSCGTPRRSCGIRIHTAISLRSSTKRSRC